MPSVAVTVQMHSNILMRDSANGIIFSAHSKRCWFYITFSKVVMNFKWIEFCLNEAFLDRRSQQFQLDLKNTHTHIHIFDRSICYSTLEYERLRLSCARMHHNHWLSNITQKLEWPCVGNFHFICQHQCWKRFICYNQNVFTHESIKFYHSMSLDRFYIQLYLSNIHRRVLS